MIEFKNLKELMASLKDEAACRQHMEEMRWGGNPVCLHCGGTFSNMNSKRRKKWQESERDNKIAGFA